jgi:hypothetical protein
MELSATNKQPIPPTNMQMDIKKTYACSGFSAKWTYVMRVGRISIESM